MAKGFGFFEKWWTHRKIYPEISAFKKIAKLAWQPLARSRTVSDFTGRRIREMPTITCSFIFNALSRNQGISRRDLERRSRCREKGSILHYKTFRRLWSIHFWSIFLLGKNLGKSKGSYFIYTACIFRKFNAIIKLNQMPYIARVHVLSFLKDNE